MIIPIWMADWEHQCCGPEINPGDRAEWPIYFHCKESPTPTDEAPRFAVISDMDVEAVWRWESRETNVDGITTVANWAHLHVGVFVHMDADPGDTVVKYRGRVWHELHNSEPPPAVVGTVRAIYWHPAIIQQVGPHEQRIDGYQPGVAIGSTSTVPMGEMGAFRFALDVEGL